METTGSVLRAQVKLLCLVALTRIMLQPYFAARSILDQFQKVGHENKVGPGCKIPVLLFKSGYWKLVNQLILNGFILNVCPPTVPLLGAGNIWWV